MGTMTKIVCTLGPATDTAERVNALVANGMRVARLNFSHAGDDYTYPEMCMGLVRNSQGAHYALAGVDGIKIPANLRGVLVDTKGPEIRTGLLPSSAESMDIEIGDSVVLTIKDVSGEEPSSTPHMINVDYKSIAKSMKIGGFVLIDDGLIELEVVTIDPNMESVTCVALNGGPVKKNKGVNLPGVELDLPALTDKDKRDLKWSCEVGADYVAASFIRTAANVRSVIAFLERCIAELPEVENGPPRLRPLVISKIESKEGVDNFDAILKESDGIMVARGDLGVEIPYYEVFSEQKKMVGACNLVGKPVIVATQMLDSMQRNPRPTRAEVTDVGTAVLDGSDSVMLSGETAAGKYPIASIKAMSTVAGKADIIRDKASKVLWNAEHHESLTASDQELDAVAHAVCSAARDMNAKMIVTITMGGHCARFLARHNPPVPVLAFCKDPQVGRRLNLHRGVFPVMLLSFLDPTCKSTRMGELRAEAIRTAKELGYVTAGDRIIIMDRSEGKDHDPHAFSHNMKVVTLV